QIDCSQYPSGVTDDGRPWVACPDNLELVCGTDGNTYTHECGICLYNKEHNASVEKERDGKCEPKPVPIDCSHYPSKLIDGHVMVPCPLMLKPVCGSDSFTYDHECGICAYNAEHNTSVAKIHDGECKENVAVDCRYPKKTTEDGKVLVFCPKILNPVCGTDGNTYPNECELCAHNAEKGTHVGKKHSGQCRQKTSELDCSQYPPIKIEGGKALVRCQKILRPVCGTDGFTYGNECGICAHNVQHGTEVKKSHEGRCKEESALVECSSYLNSAKPDEANMACPLILRELCGTDGVTYSNDCELCAHNIIHRTEVAKKHDGRCIEEALQLNCPYGVITTNNGSKVMPCPRNYDPVCGTDGVTYPNRCVLCAYNLEHHTNIGIRKNGCCEEDITR
ncbi:IOV7 protein, partial [Calyptomena viridis]|nr:IOV7 protein [Calyptomena viridis]